MANSIGTLLGYTAAEIEALYIERYMRWCQSYAKELGIPLQLLFANTAISKWYGKEHEELEYMAFQTLKPTYGQIRIAKARDIYTRIMIDIFSTYPKPLFDAAAKLEIINTVTHDPSAN